MADPDSIDGLTIPKLPLKFYNTETRQKEEFTPLENNHVRMYTCGPTVYHFAHIGNFRTYVFEDVLRRTLKFFGYQLTQVMNLTDIDDKTIRGAIKENVSLKDFTKPYIEAFFVDLKELGIEKVEHYPAATEYIPSMIVFIQKLLDKGIAYKSKDKSIYYSIEQFPRYGRLSHLKLNELKVGAGDARVFQDEYEKEYVGDFVLWKAYDPERDGNIYWESPFGLGRPGWHLECSTMATSLLGPTLDIHVGAVDNIFPHHENEIAQSEAFSGKPFVRFWLHSEHLVVNHKKMSKSLGNFYTLRDLLSRGMSGMDVRYLLMQTHYRTSLNFTFEGIEAAKASLQRLNDFILRMQEISDEKSPTTLAVRQLLQKALNDFANSMADDLGISQALAVLFDVMRSINSLADSSVLSKGDAAAVLQLFREFNRILGVLKVDVQEKEAPAELRLLLQKRNAARAEKKWDLADQLRKEIFTQGYVIEDTAGGTRLKKR